METKSKFRINLKTGEIEIEGSEEFISAQIAELSSLISLFDSSSLAVLDGQSESELEGLLDKEDINKDQQEDLDITVPKSFGEWYHKFKTDISDTDKSLIAGYFVQVNSSTNDFKTLEVNKVLKENGIKLSNASTFIKSLAKNKQVFQTRKEGKLNYMRVSKTGEKYLKSIME